MSRHHDQVLESLMSYHRGASRQSDALVFRTVQLQQENAAGLYVPVKCPRRVAEVSIITRFPLRTGDDDDAIIRQPHAFHFRGGLDLEWQLQGATGIFKVGAAIPRRNISKDEHLSRSCRLGIFGKRNGRTDNSSEDHGATEVGHEPFAARDIAARNQIIRVRGRCLSTGGYGVHGVTLREQQTRARNTTGRWDRSFGNHPMTSFIKARRRLWVAIGRKAHRRFYGPDDDEQVLIRASAPGCRASASRVRCGYDSAGRVAENDNWSATGDTDTARFIQATNVGSFSS